MSKSKKINRLSEEELHQKLEELKQHDLTLNSKYAHHLLDRIKSLRGA